MGRRRQIVAAAVATTVALLMALLPTVFAPAGAAVGDPSQVNTTLEGCRNNGTINLPINGQFVCPDAAYTTGNLGKGWNELDLVPHRLTTSVGTQAGATAEYTLALVADNEEAGKPGYDVMSAPVVNTAKSHTSCQINPTAQATLTPGIGGTDTSIYRKIAIKQDKGTTCVFDYWERLALGSHLYSGSSLHSNLTNQLFGTAGVGARDVSIPVKEILPQELRKDMTATQDQDFTWNITKAATPTQMTFVETCSSTPGPSTRDVSVRIEWEKIPTTANAITVVTNIYAKNPAHRTITVSVTDDIRSGTSVLDTASATDVDVPAGTELKVLTHTTTVPAGTTNINDVATATYTDKVAQVAVPGQTQATASANVQAGTVSNATAVITDSESITGTNLQFAVLSTSGASGTFGGGYVPNSVTPTYTTGPVTWTSGTQTGDGFVVFNKRVKVTEPSNTSGTLSDTATVTGSSGFTAQASATTTISASATVSLTIKKSIPVVLGSGDSSYTFTFHVKNASDQTVATRTITFSSGHGGSGNFRTATVMGLAPGTYTVHEETLAPFAPRDPVTVPIAARDCSGEAEFTNGFDNPTARVKKVTVPAANVGGWVFRLSGPASGLPEDVTIASDGSFHDFTTPLTVEGSYTITEIGGPSGYDQTNSTGCSFTVNLPADAGRQYSCTFENSLRPKLKLVKTVSGSSPGVGYKFELRTGASPTSEGTLVDPPGQKTTDADGKIDFGDLSPGTYQLCEVGVPGGWIVTFSNGGTFVPFLAKDSTVDNSTICVDVTLAYGDNKTVNVNNEPPPGGDARTIGYWKNWSSCTGGRQDHVLDAVLASFPVGANETTNGVLIGDIYVDTCAEAFAILNKSTLSGSKRASDPLYNMAAQFLATRLNYQQGLAQQCANVTAKFGDAQALLDKYDFDATGDYRKGLSKADANLANSLASLFDSYNNNTGICT